MDKGNGKWEMGEGEGIKREERREKREEGREMTRDKREERREKNTPCGPYKYYQVLPCSVGCSFCFCYHSSHLNPTIPDHCE